MLDFSGDRGFYENGILRIDDFSATCLNFSFETLRRQPAFFLSTITLIASFQNYLSSSSASFIDYLQFSSPVYMCMMRSPIDYNFFGFSLFSVSHARVPQHFHACEDYSKLFFLFLKSSRVWEDCTERFRGSGRLQYCSTFTLKNSLSVTTFVTFQSCPESVTSVRHIEVKISHDLGSKLHHSMLSFFPSPLRPLSFAF